jgi:lactoylglutathione lyase
MTMSRLSGGAVILAISMTSATAFAQPAAYHHVHLNTPPNADDGARWYITHMDCKPYPGRTNVVNCGPAIFLFLARDLKGPSLGSGVNHIGFSFANLETKVKALEAAGVKVTLPVRDVPGLFKVAFVEDPWGTRIELVEHEGYSGFHHVHLSSPDPNKTLAWYQNVFGGVRRKVKETYTLEGVLYGKVWLYALATKEPIAPTEGRAVEHIGFSYPSLDAAAPELKKKGVTFTQEVTPIQNNIVVEKFAFVSGPDGVKIELIESPKP